MYFVQSISILLWATCSGKGFSGEDFIPLELFFFFWWCVYYHFTVILQDIIRILGRCQYNVTGWDRSHGLPALSRVWQHVKLSDVRTLRNQPTNQPNHCDGHHCFVATLILPYGAQLGESLAWHYDNLRPYCYPRRLTHSTIQALQLFRQLLSVPLETKRLESSPSVRILPSVMSHRIF